MGRHDHARASRRCERRRIDPIVIMADANALPEQHLVDFSLVYE